MATLILDDELHGRLRRLAEARAQSPQAIVREAVDQMLDREQKRADFIGEAEASWDKFQRDGRHLTGDEVFAWLGTWGKDRVPPPPCHD